MKSTITRRRMLAACALALPALHAFGQAAPFPTKLVRIVLPFPPGSANDIALRMVAEKLTEKWKQNVIVEYRPGGSTIIGTEAVARARADGHTLLANITSIVQNSALGRKLPYDLKRDLRPIAMVHRTQVAVLARSDLPASTLPEIFAFARRNPGKLNLADWGVGSTGNLVYEKMRVDQKLDFTLVTYKGGVEIITALLAGDVQVGMADLLSPAQHLRAGKLKVIGVTGPSRLPAYPNAPTLAESGVSGFEGFNWFGLFAPGQLDTAIALQINQAVNEALADPDIAKRFREDLIVEPGRLSLSEWEQTVDRDLASWQGVVRITKVSVE